MMNEMVPTLNNWERKEERKCFAFIHPDWKAIFTHHRTNTTFFEGIWFCILNKFLKNLLSLIIIKCRQLDFVEARKISIGKALLWLQGSCLVCLQSWIVHFLAAWSLDKWSLVWWWIVRFPDPHYVVSLSGNQTRWLLAACNSLQHLIIDCDDNCENCWLRASKPSSSLIAMIVIIADCLLPCCRLIIDCQRLVLCRPPWLFLDDEAYPELSPLCG